MSIHADRDQPHRTIALQQRNAQQQTTWGSPRPRLGQVPVTCVDPDVTPVHKPTTHPDPQGRCPVLSCPVLSSPHIGQRQRHGPSYPLFCNIACTASNSSATKHVVGRAPIALHPSTTHSNPASPSSHPPQKKPNASRTSPSHQRGLPRTIYPRHSSARDRHYHHPSIHHQRVVSVHSRESKPLGTNRTSTCHVPQ